MQTEAEVLTDHSELICSTSIKRIVTGRNAALKQIEQLIEQLDAISRQTSEIGGGTAQDWAMKSGHRYDSWLTEKADKAMPAVTRTILLGCWNIFGTTFRRMFTKMISSVSVTFRKEPRTSLLSATI